jgi:peptidoglycan hydrolase-like protein with peptidoglycan-binding domain
MVKTYYKKELAISQTCAVGSKGNDVSKCQEWLSLFEFVNPGSGTAVRVDGQFGSGTQRAVQTYQTRKKLPVTGKVDQRTFASLCEPMSRAFDTPAEGTDLRKLIIRVAQQHLANNPYELTINGESNRGPWVRAYCQGNEGEQWYWCMGFVQSIVDQAASTLGKDFRSLMPLTYSCDTVGMTGLQKKLLSRYTEVRNNPALVKPGDIFLLQKTPTDWYHTGFVVSVSKDVFETIEGNTNVDGSANGNGVYRRVRNFRSGSSKIDVFSIEPLLQS